MLGSLYNFCLRQVLGSLYNFCLRLMLDFSVLYNFCLRLMPEFSVLYNFCLCLMPEFLSVYSFCLPGLLGLPFNFILSQASFLRKVTHVVNCESDFYVCSNELCFSLL